MNNRADWTFRIYQESKLHVWSHFVTLTYSDEQLPTDGSLKKDDVQRFMKRLRKLIYPLKVRYYLVGEYGTESGRAHYHIILFGLESAEVILPQVWPHGLVDIRKVEMGSIHYVTKYHVNRFGDHSGREPPFCFMSKRPGLGSNYLDSHKKWHRRTMSNFTKVNGSISRLPRFYKEKMFSALERERFAIESVDIGVEDYRKAVAQLSKFHEDPENYYYERLVHLHENVRHKINSLNKF